MNTKSFFHSGISKTDFVLEIGPYVNPLFPKCEGWNVISNDVFSYDELITKAKGDDNLDDDDLEKMIEQHFEAHPSVNEENMYEYEDNLSAISKNPRLESIIKKVNNKKSTYADIKDSLKK